MSQSANEQPATSNQQQVTSNQTMIKNYLVIAFRTLLKHKTFSAINIFGLALGMASALVIFLYAKQELTYDGFHEKAEQVYRLTYDERESRPADGRFLATTSPPMGPALVASYPEILKCLRLRFSENDVLAYGERRFFENGGVYADSTFFEMFSFSLKAGNAATALREPNSIVLTPQTAAKYFGAENPLGKTLTLNHERELKVTGVLHEMPRRTHVQCDFLISFSTFRVPTGYPVTLESWSWISFHTYLLLAPNAKPELLERKLPDFMQTHAPERAGKFRLGLQPITAIYLDAPKHADVASGNRALPYGLLVVGALILLLAAMNYINLATARALDRGKEVGIRKVAGASRAELVRQFLGEALLLTFCSFVLALASLEIFLKMLRAAFNLDLLLAPMEHAQLVGFGLVLAVLIGVFAGSYPAFMTASFQPIKVLKGKFRASATGLALRKTLVGMQFGVTTALLVATLVIARQMDFVRNKNLGFEREAVIVLHMMRDGSEARYALLKDRLRQNPHVLNVSASSGLLDGDNGSVPIYPEGRVDERPMASNILGVRHDFFKLLNIRMSEGREFSEQFASDVDQGIVLNQSAARALGWENPVGKKLRIGDLVDGQVIGVAEDFHFASLRNQIQPLAVFVAELVENVYLKIRPGDLSALLASLESDWKHVAPEQPFRFTFLDEHLARLYANDQKFARLISVFTALALAIASLGLYGLIAFITRQRTKELGIRKVLGASAMSVAALLSKDFVKLLLFANFIAWPIAYFAMNRWLQDFAYRIEIGWWIFALAGGVALGIALLTVSTQAIRAALANPVEALRYE